MIKKSIYPKTKRMLEETKFVITEKLDGSNLCIFKKDGIIYLAQRIYIFSSDELTTDNAYKGLFGWLQKNLKTLQDELVDGSVICGEWIGMGKLSYNFDTKFFMFAKANITEDFELKNINYNHELFIYPFKSKEIPSFIKEVPFVANFTKGKPSVEDLNNIYDVYAYSVERSVEGFVVENNNTIEKYVRMKNGKLEPHKSNYKGEE